MKLAEFLVCQFVLLMALTAATIDDSRERLVEFDQFKVSFPTSHTKHSNLKKKLLVLKKRHKKKYNGTNTESRRFRRWKELKGIIDQHNKEAIATDEINFYLVDNFLADQVKCRYRGV